MSILFAIGVLLVGGAGGWAVRPHAETWLAKLKAAKDDVKKDL